MDKKLNYMLDAMNTPSTPKWITEIMEEAGVQTKVLNISCRDCSEPLDDDNIYGQCPHCYFKGLNG